MNKKYKIAASVAIAILLVGMAVLATIFFSSHSVAVLNPKGIIAEKQRNLMIIATLLMLIVVVPVFILTFSIAWRYRAGNQKAKYSPDWDRSRTIETIWWVVPLVIILVLAGFTWTSSHELDPYKPLASSAKPIKIQVIALQWKWLFIYPEQHIASVNFMQIPKQTPIDFEITSDAPMNSFWIPQLGGQVYAMTGMSTKLHLMANEVGDYQGSSANISGKGFAGMKFTARASTKAEFDQWVANTKRSSSRLNLNEYKNLMRPSENNPPSVYYLPASNLGLYDTVVMKYMMPDGHN
jgi:cytochrome o ubiquinol oxidase subunit 2